MMWKAFNLSKIVSFFFIAFLASGAILAQEFKSIEPLLEKVQPDSIRAHIKYLADDKLRGRLPNTPGYQMAMDYVVSKYKSLGLLPAGDNQTYLQKVKFRKAKINKEESRAVL